MSEYIVSARKYRPDSFESLIGQDNIAQTLKNSILRGQLAHAYLFCGPRGVGKTSTARIFAKTINCMNPTANMEPCGECESCVSFAEGRSYCIYELDAASNNSVEDIKTLMEKVQIPPQVGKYSVYIIDEVHMLSQAAFNAFLKTLEEPPSYAIFILCTTEKHKVLPTILSRCQTYDFNRIGIPDMVRNLRAIADKEGIKVGDESLHVIARKADGAMRDALTIFDQTVAFCGTDIRYEEVIRNLGVLDYEYCFRLVDCFLSGNYASALLEFDDILAKGFNALHFISALGGHLRDLLVARTGGLDALLDLPDSLKERYREQASKCSVKFLYDALGISGNCEAGYKSSTNQRLHIEYALMRLSFLGGVPADTAPASAPAPAPAPKPAPRTAPAPEPAPAPKAAPAPEPAPAKATVETVAEEEVIEIIAPDDMVPAPKVETASAPAAPETTPSHPAAPETPAEPEKPRRRGSRASALIGSMLADSQDASGKEASAPAAGSAVELPSEEDVTGKWLELAAAVAADKPRLYNTLKNSKLSVVREEGGYKVGFEVVNEAQKAWIEKEQLRKMEQRYNEILHTTCISLHVEVQHYEESAPKIYLDADKAKELMKNNPEVLNLVKDLGLDAK